MIIPRPNQRRRCYCGEAAVALCDWKVPKRVEVPVEDLTTEHRIMCRIGRKLDGDYEITSIDHVPRFVGGFYYQVTISVEGAPVKFLWPPGSYAGVLGEGPCETACCELHLRAVDEGRHYCQQHWPAWEKVA